MPTVIVYFLLMLGLALPVSSAGDFRTNSRISQIMGTVSTGAPAGPAHPAQLNELFSAGDLLTTGPASRAELTAADQTVIRVGSNSVFSFNNQARQIILQQGSLLFHTPHGEGGGVIRTAAVTAAVTGSTVSISTTSSGGAKVVPLESTCIVTGKDGRQIARVNPGQMLALLPGGKPLVFAIDLGAFVKSSGLVNKFSAPLDATVGAKIQQNVDQQQSRSPAKTGVVVFDDLAVSSSIVRPPPQIQAPQQFAPVSADPLSSAFATSLNLNAVQFGKQTTTVFPLNGPDATGSGLPFLQKQNGQPPSSYFSNLPYSDPTLATFGITPALPASYTLPPAAASQIVARDVVLGTTVLTPQNGRSGDPDAADLSAYRANGSYGVAAQGNLSFSVPAGDNTDRTFTIVNAPDQVTFGAGGTFTMDGSSLAPGHKLRLTAFDTHNLVLGSVGTMTFTQAEIDLDPGTLDANGQLANHGFLYAGSLTELDLNSLYVSDAEGISFFSGGNINVNGQVILFNGSGTTLQSSFTAVGDINILADLHVQSYSQKGRQTDPVGMSNTTLTSTAGSINVPGSITIGPGNGGTLTLTSLKKDVNVTGSIVFGASSGNSLTINASQLASFNPSTTFDGTVVSSFAMTANTVFLNNASFSSSNLVTLRSADQGAASFTANNGGSIRVGAVNIGPAVTEDAQQLNPENVNSYPNFRVNPSGLSPRNGVQ